VLLIVERSARNTSQNWRSTHKAPGHAYLMPEVQEKRQQAEKLSAPRWWMVYTATLLYLAFIILLLDWLTRHFRPS
jgi:ABC-type branched-subunit amino acid transport system ATPase component